jgi:SAM-dependent methyltransferase
MNTRQGKVCPVCRLYSQDIGRLWLKLDDTSPQGFDHEAATRLKGLSEHDHFWIRERTRLVAQLLLKLQGSSADNWACALELGCGSGAMLPLLEARAREVVAMDGHSTLLQHALEASMHSLIIQGDVTNTQLEANNFELIMALDVLEHVDADVFLSEAHRLACKDGKLLISVPAFSCLWSDFDVRAGHRCRYRWSQLKIELARNGWKPLGYTHFQCLLFPLVYMSRQFSATSTGKIQYRPPQYLDKILGIINHLELTLFKGVSLPFGSSLFAWASAD